MGLGRKLERPPWRRDAGKSCAPRAGGHTGQCRRHGCGLEPCGCRQIRWNGVGLGGFGFRADRCRCVLFWSGDFARSSGWHFHSTRGGGRLEPHARPPLGWILAGLGKQFFRSAWLGIFLDHLQPLHAASDFIRRWGGGCLCRRVQYDRAS